jgi:hypothetical protein
MDDLISRKALLADLCEDREEGTFEFTDVQAEAADRIIRYVDSRIEKLPSVPAVPLDKLCEYLNSVIYPCIICKESPGPQCNAKRKGCWNRVLTKWMEGLDDHR